MADRNVPEMVVRVALAIRAAIEASEHNFGEVGTMFTCQEAAVAAIKAMREPIGGRPITRMPPRFGER